MRIIALALFLPIAVSGCAGCNTDEPTPYAASTPAAPVPTATTPDVDARLAEAEARAATAEAALAQQSATSAPQPAPNSASGTYSGAVNAGGLRQFCETYDRTSVARFKGLMVCYNIQMQQSNDGTLQGTGYKSWEVMPGTNGRDLDPSEQSPIRVTGRIDGNDTIHLRYTVQGARRSTNGTATFDGGRTLLISGVGGDSEEFPGTFKSDAANASGSATFSSDALID